VIVIANTASHVRSVSNRTPEMDVPLLVPPIVPERAVYTSCYCEENVFLLAKAFLADASITEIWDISVVFISNETKTVGEWLLKASEGDCIILTGSTVEPEAGQRSVYASGMGLSCSPAAAPTGGWPKQLGVRFRYGARSSMRG
jgi:hypothetical protein